MKNILVTGGAGFIGSHWVRTLVSLGYSVRVIDDLSRGTPERLADIQSQIQIYRGDIRSEEAVSRAMKGIDAVFHLAYINGTSTFYQKPFSILDIAGQGTLNVVKAALDTGVDDIIFASSSEVYQTPELIPTPETVPLIVPDIRNPRYSYGGGKIFIELVASALVNEGRFRRVMVFRPHNVYGPDMGFAHVIPELTKKIYLSKKAQRDSEIISIPLKGDGLQQRCFVHINDFTAALSLIFERGDHGDWFHIGNPQPTTIKELSKKIARTMGSEIKVHHESEFEGETRIRMPDIAKLKMLGFCPNIDLEKGLSSVVPGFIRQLEGVE